MGSGMTLFDFFSSTWMVCFFAMIVGGWERFMLDKYTRREERDTVGLGKGGLFSGNIKRKMKWWFCSLCCCV